MATLRLPGYTAYSRLELGLQLLGPQLPAWALSWYIFFQPWPGARSLWDSALTSSARFSASQQKSVSLEALVSPCVR